MASAAAEVAAAVDAGGVAVVVGHAPGVRARELRAPLADLVETLLAPYGGRLDRDADGRPVVTGADLRVSLSYTDAAAAAALSRAPLLGVDVERRRAVTRLDGLVSYVCSAAERTGAPEGETERLDWFYRLWTRKEAVLKAWGTGLGVRPMSFRLAPPEDGWGPVGIEPGYVARPPVVTRGWADGDLYLALAVPAALPVTRTDVRLGDD